MSDGKLPREDDGHHYYHRRESTSVEPPILECRLIGEPVLLLKESHVTKALSGLATLICCTYRWVGLGISLGANCIKSYKPCSYCTQVSSASDGADDEDDGDLVSEDFAEYVSST